MSYPHRNLNSVVVLCVHCFLFPCVLAPSGLSCRFVVFVGCLVDSRFALVCFPTFVVDLCSWYFGVSLRTDYLERQENREVQTPCL